MALYNKFRPDTFGDVQGHEIVVDSVTSKLADGSFPHAYLMAGQRGTGKTTIAKLIARYLSCDSPKGFEPCNECKSCKSAKLDAHADISEIDGASNNGVDDIRRLKADIKYPPMNGKYKIYIIDEVHMLSIPAFNALLKSIEEPPKYVVFIFATTELHKVPGTIKSRCEIHSFARMKPEVISSRLKYIAEKENFNLLPEAADLLANNADGSMRDSISILGTMTHKDVIDTDVVMDSLGLIDETLTDGFVEAMLNEETEMAIALYQGVLQKGKSASQLIESIIKLLTDRMMHGTRIIEYSNFLKAIVKFKREFSQEQNIQLVFNLLIIDYSNKDTSSSTVDNGAVTKLTERFNEFEESTKKRFTRIEEWIKKFVESRKNKSKQTQDTNPEQEQPINHAHEGAVINEHEVNNEPVVTCEDNSMNESTVNNTEPVIEKVAPEKQKEDEVVKEKVKVEKKDQVNNESIKAVNDILSRLQSFGVKK